MSKRFYWLKLKESFMTSDIVDYFMSQPDGANYVVLYQMLCLKTINTEGRLARQIGEVLIPYDLDKIQRDCKWFSADTVRVAMELYKAFGLVYEDVDGVLVMADHANLVGSETDKAGLMRKKRASNNVTKMLPECYTEIEIENRDKENKRLDKEVKRFTPPTLEEVEEFVKERNSTVDAKRFFEYYDTADWKDGKGNKVKSWKQKLITWEKHDTVSRPQKKTYNTAATATPSKNTLDELERLMGEL